MNAALILAAGRGVRVGGPKACMLVGGAPLAVAHVAARKSDCQRVVVVSRADILARLPLHPEGSIALVASEEDDALGPAGSIRASLAALGGVERVLVTPVDVPPAPSSVVRALFDALDDADASKFAHGHPIAIRLQILVDRYTHGAPPLREVMHDLLARHRLRVLPPPSHPLPRALDHVADVVALTGAPPQFFGSEAAGSEAR